MLCINQKQKILDIEMDEKTSAYVQVWDIIENDENILGYILPYLEKFDANETYYTKFIEESFYSITFCIFDKNLKRYFNIDLIFGKFNNLGLISRPKLCITSDLGNYSEFEILNTYNDIIIYSSSDLNTEYSSFNNITNKNLSLN